MPLLLLLPGAGGTAQEVGGPLDKEGAVGKQFTTEGSVGERCTVERRVRRAVQCPVGLACVHGQHGSPGQHTLTTQCMCSPLRQPNLARMHVQSPQSAPWPEAQADLDACALLCLAPHTGGTVQEAAEAVDEKGEEMQRKAQQQQGQEKLKEDTPGMSRDKL